jgi:hypothetical protein
MNRKFIVTAITLLCFLSVRAEMAVGQTTGRAALQRGMSVSALLNSVHSRADFMRCLEDGGITEEMLASEGQKLLSNASGAGLPKVGTETNADARLTLEACLAADDSRTESSATARTGDTASASKLANSVGQVFHVAAIDANTATGVEPGATASELAKSPFMPVTSSTFSSLEATKISATEAGKETGAHAAQHVFAPRETPFIEDASAWHLSMVGEDLSSIPASSQFNKYVMPGTGVTATLAAAVQTTLPPLIISEFRFRGSMGANDEYIELYNNSNTHITVSTTDGSSGWGVASLAPGSGQSTQHVFTVPNGTIIPARGYYLAVNSSRYSLSASADRDNTFSNNIADGAGIALYNTSNPANQITANRMDAVGFSSVPSTEYREGTGLAPHCQGLTPLCEGGFEHAFVRKLNSGQPQDTNDNAADFLFVSVTGDAYNGVQSMLGAPGPQNLRSPISRSIPLTLLDPAVPSSAAPNRARDTTDTGPNKIYGTLNFRRTLTNNTGVPITRLRFRVVNITTKPAPNSTTADLRVLTSPTVNVTMSDNSVVQVKGTTLETPPAQGKGGGYNSTLALGTITLATPLANNGTMNLQMSTGVMQSGSFSFLIIIEAALAGNSASAAPTVSLTSPANGATFQAPVNITLSATASDTDGYVNKVEFYAVNSSSVETLVGTDSTAPYSVVWSNPAAGTYQIKAKATDEQGVSTTSASNSITVNPAFASTVPGPPAAPECKTADVVAFDQVFFYNRFGALNPAGMIYALRRDVVAVDSDKGLTPGNVRLRDGKRPRPIVLRMNMGDCISIRFQNLLSPDPLDNQPHTRKASIHVDGLQLVNTILDDGSNVGNNPSSLVAPGGTATYTLYGEREGGHVLYSTGATTSGEGDGGTLAFGLFGSVNVEPVGAEYYRSQVTEEEMRLATTGVTATGQPLINYDAVYPSWHRFAGLPILKMLKGKEIVHSDLNAVITYQNRQRFPQGTYPPVAVEPDRDQPFREFTVIYHDEIKAVQAFEEFEDPVLEHTLHSVRDAFAINYGTGGIGAEILANRKLVGPVWNCVECLYEEFFLSAWAVADPAMIVDVPANVKDENGNLVPGPKATRAFFPDDPSNVHHAYLNDHTKMRVMHAGPKEHHIHHLHAHQWLHTPDADTSTMLDSQAISPGSSFNTEIAHGGAGNRSKTVGDAIFHCHFYPHFAMGMWELWRVHDVFEKGTEIGSDGRPVVGARALPDGEISKGTPIPALVPIPTRPMAPVPTAVHPGYPFFIPGVAGHRPPHPPLDTEFDGGLPRHVIIDGEFVEQHTRLNFDKSLVKAIAHSVPEDGTDPEKRAMEFHALPFHASTTPEGTPGNFITNGRPPKPGAPYADPCPLPNEGQPATRDLIYSAAVFQLDVIFNKAGWHFPQQRISALWEDVDQTRAGTRPPQPLFFRANTNDCITFRFTNLVPRVYAQDDFQVRTPTDIMGQHIHLVKFDVTSSDGAGNGWNYEDGSFAPEEVIERIHAINEEGGLRPPFGEPGDPKILEPQPHPRFGTLGAQITIQRWFTDNVLDNQGNDRTHRTAFTHDHFGPSTHQQVGQYAGLVVEPEGSIWRDPETGEVFGTRAADGGPTSWRADIITLNQADSFREFLIEFADFQHAYLAGGGIDEAGNPIADPQNVVNPPAKQEADFQPPFILLEKMEVCPGGVPLPCPEAISAADVGTMVINYRNEPIPYRIWDPTQSDPNYGTPVQAAGPEGDLANVYRSDIIRKDTRFNVQPNFYPPLTAGIEPGDPFTPLLRAFEDDRVQVRILVGAHEEGHNFTINGIKWLFEPSFPNSGWRNSQMMGISEHYEFVVPVLPMPDQTPGPLERPFFDFRYAPGMASDDQWNGLWGILRAYRGSEEGVCNDCVPPPCDGCIIIGGGGDGPGGGGDIIGGTDGATSGRQLSPTTTGAGLLPLPSNPDGKATISSAVNSSTNAPTAVSASSTNSTLSSGGNIINSTAGIPVCPDDANHPPPFEVTAALARDILPAQTLVYNSRTNQGGRLEDPTAIIYVRNSDIDPNTHRLKSYINVEPLILRANAGDCITLTLYNQIPAAIDLPGHNTLPMIVERFNNNQIKPSTQVGLHPQLLFYDVTRSDGMNVGFNNVQTAPSGGSITYKWYAGDVTVDNNGTAIYTPVEFGATSLIPADPIKHAHKGAIGALIIEPVGSTYADMSYLNTGKVTHAMSVITPANAPSFIENVLLFQNDINMRFGSRLDQWNNLKAVPNLAGEDDPEDTGQKAANYRTEPFWKRMNYEPDLDFEETRKKDFSNVLSNSQIGANPQTPLFNAGPGRYTRFRLLHPGGHPRNHAFTLYGHLWQEEPYINNSTKIGDNPLSEWTKGTQYGIGPSSHFDINLTIGMGGRFKIRGDYLWRDRASFTFDGGIWGIFRMQ